MSTPTTTTSITNTSSTTTVTSSKIISVSPKQQIANNLLTTSFNSGLSIINKSNVSKQQSLPKSLTISSISNNYDNKTPMITSPPTIQQQQSLILSSPANNNETSNEQQQQQQQITDTTNTKIYEMNTYVQLEIDNNNSLCIPRTCKFTIKKLVLKRELIQQMLQIASLNSNQNQQLSNNHHQNHPSQQQQANSLIIAIKLNTSKRILRTIELPLNRLIKPQQQLLNEQYLTINLNLFYNISYSHYLKKSTNLLYIYIQRRKKYKNRALLGYKTLSFAKIDLQSIMQRTYNVDLLLETISNQSILPQTPLTTSSLVQNSSINNKYSSSVMLQIDPNEALLDVNQLQQQYGQQICGYLTINSLSSHSFDYQINDFDHVETKNNQNDELNDGTYGGGGGEDDENNSNIPTTIINGTSPSIGNPLTNVLATLTSKNKTLNIALNSLKNRSVQSDNSDVEVESTNNTNILKIKRGNNKRSTINAGQQTNSSNNKKFTGKLISFIRKLRINDDTTVTSPSVIMNNQANNSKNKSANNTINEDDEQISDFSDNNSIGSASDIEADLYSIISTPKPCLQPFFKPITTSDATLKSIIVDNNNDEMEINEIINERDNLDVEINFNNNDLVYNQQFDLSHHQQSPIKNKTIINTDSIIKYLDSFLQSSITTTPIEISYYLSCDLNFFIKLKDSLTNCYLFNLSDLQLTQQRDLRSLVETIINWYNNNKQQLMMLFNKKYQQYYYYSQHQPYHQLLQIKFILFGNDQFLNQFLRIYVDIFKTQDLLNLFKFYFIPYFTSSSSSSSIITNMQSTYYLAKLLFQYDSFYQYLFGDDYWLQLDNSLNYYDVKEVVQRVHRFIKYSSQSFIQIQICEAMINIDENIVEIENENQQNDNNQQQSDINDGNIVSSTIEDNNTSLNLTTTNIVTPTSCFIPFICDVKIGGNITQVANSSTNDQLNDIEQILTSSPSHNNTKDDLSPPNSPNPNNIDEINIIDYDLQVDYWTSNQQVVPSLSSSSSSSTTTTNVISISSTVSSLVQNQLNTNSINLNQISTGVDSQQTKSQSQINNKDNQIPTTTTTTSSKITKSTTKGLFKYLHIYRLNLFNNLNQNLIISPTTTSSSSSSSTSHIMIHQYGQEALNNVSTHNLSMAYIIKEKKQKIMRLGKKSKDHDHKKDSIDGLTRLVCTSRTQNVPLKVFIDGIEWKNIKFFQISSQWQGHIKFLNLMFGSQNKTHHDPI